MTEAQLSEGIPQWILDCPVSAHWVWYRGQMKFAMLNYEESIKKGRPMIDICYCATAGMINGRVERTVRYKECNFLIDTK